MKEIPLTQGKVAIVDDCDYEWLVQRKWFATRVTLKNRTIWYARHDKRLSGGSRSRTYMHREIAAVAGIPQVDHYDGDGLHNWRNNLRPASGRQNNQNRRKTSGCTSKFKGVWWDKNWERWRAHIKISGRMIILGSFDTEEDAARAYDVAAIAAFGEFALCNFPVVKS